MATVLFLVAAATSHLPTSSQGPMNHWFSCKTPERTQCVSYEMPLQHRKPVGYWQAKKSTRYVVYPYFHRHVKQVHRIARSAYRQVTRAVQNTYWYTVTGYAPPAACGASGPTASGVWPYYGVAASTLPFGTRGYVPGYGPFIALDTGSAIGTGRLDLYFPTCSQAIAWGVRSVRVQIYG